VKIHQHEVERQRKALYYQGLSSIRSSTQAFLSAVSYHRFLHVFDRSGTPDDDERKKIRTARAESARAAQGQWDWLLLGCDKQLLIRHFREERVNCKVDSVSCGKFELHDGSKIDVD